MDDRCLEKTTDIKRIKKEYLRITTKILGEEFKYGKLVTT